MAARLTDLIALELLVAVSDHGSVGAAARHCGVAQPNATRSLARLERGLGVALLVRAPTGSTLTPAGLVVVEHARRVLEAEGALRGAVTAFRGDAPVALSVAASQTVAEHLLPMWLAALRAEHPDAAVEFEVANTRSVVDAVVHGRVQLGFVEGPRPPSGLQHAVVGRDELVVVVAPGHPWARRRRPVTDEELLGTPLVTREAGSGTRVTLDEALGAAVPAYQELPSNAAVRVSVASGAAPAVLSLLAVGSALADGSLVRVPTASRFARTLHAVWSGPRRAPGLAGELTSIARRHPGRAG